MSLSRQPARVLVAAVAGVIALGALAAFVLRGHDAAPAAAGVPEPQALRYAREYPPIDYTAERPDGDIARLERRIAAGELELDSGAERDAVVRVLEALDIDPASQMLVFSKTSRNPRTITPATPRAIYFNDEHYVAYVQDRPLEIATIDADVGAVFYTLELDAAGSTRVQRRTSCLRCHDSYSLSGGGVPRLMIGSGYTDTSGRIVSHEGWILTSDRTPLSSRWGGWYVTGRHGDAVHLGNIAVRDAAAFENLEQLRDGNRESLEGLVDTSPYPVATSDIVALMVLAHQIRAQNAITRAHYDVETALARRADAGASGAAGSTADASDPVDETVAEAAEPLVRALLFDGEATLPAPIEGTSGFAEAFEARGPFDAEGRTLRELDLVDRMFTYPLSYVIYSDAFDALPDPVRQHVYVRLESLLTGPPPEDPIGHLATADRTAILEILAATKPAFAAAIGR